MAHNIQAGRYNGCIPRMLCGRKVWVAERGGYGSALKEIWVHLSPFKKAAVYLKGSSLIEGDDASNLAYLERQCCDTITAAAPLSMRLEQIWNEDAAERDAYARAAEEDAGYLPTTSAELEQ